jgi:hypothetical protein
VPAVCQCVNDNPKIDFWPRAMSIGVKAVGGGRRGLWAMVGRLLFARVVASAKCSVAGVRIFVHGLSEAVF